MEDNGVIKESELIEFDGTTQKLIDKLQELGTAMQEVSSVIQKSAGSVAESVKQVNILTTTGKQKLEEAATAAERYEAAQRGLESALAETARVMAQVKVETGNTQRVSVEHAQTVQAAEDSYTRMVAQLKKVKKELNAMSAEERAYSAEAQEKLDIITELTIKIKAYDAEVKAHIASAQQEAKAQATLANEAERAADDVGDLAAAEQRLTGASNNATRSQASLSNKIDSIAERTIKANANAKEMNRLMVLQKQAADSLAGSYNNIDARIKMLRMALKKIVPMNNETRRSYQLISQEIQELQKQLVRIQADMGEHSLNVGNYRSAWDGLGMSVNQIVRELPSAAMSLNTFFVAISNNIPILMDEVQKVIQKNKILQEQGLQTVSVGKSIVKAIFSWNSAIVLAVTALAMWGKEIIEFIGNLRSLGDALEVARKATKGINKELKETNGGYGENLVKLYMLIDRYQALESEQEREVFIAGEARDVIDDLNLAINDHNDANELLIKRTDDVILAFKLRAKAAAAYRLAQLEFDKAVAAEVKGDETLTDVSEHDFGEKFSRRFKPFSVFLPLKLLFNKDYRKAYEGMYGLYQKGTQGKSEEMAQAYMDKLKSYIKDIKELGVFDENEDDDDGSKGSKKLKDLTERIMKMRLKAEKDYQDSFLAIQEDGYEKQRMALVTANEQENDELTASYNRNLEWLAGSGTKYEKLTEEQIKEIELANQEIQATIENNDKELAQALLELAIQRRISILNVEEESLQLRKNQIKKGSQEELDLRIALIRNQRDREIAENKLKAKAEQQSEEAIRAKSKKEELLAEGEFAMDRLREEQELADKIFNITKKSTYATKKFKIEQEREFIMKQLELAELGQLQLSDTEIETLKAALAALGIEMKELNSDWTPKGILSRLGLDDESIDALKQAVDYVISQYGAILKAEEELRERQLEASKERVDAAQRAYDAEVEARNNGYANNVATTKKELLLAKSQQKEKERLLKEAQARAQRLESIMQATSLTTASAEIWKSLAGVPIIGPALALAAIGTMWTSFAAAKIKAKQVSSQEYGEGGFEMLEGGSHASGHDIDLGVKNKKGKRMHVEGGEALAVFNKKQTRRMGKVLPAIVQSINKGLFEEQFMRGLPNMQPQVIVSPSPVDLTRIEQDLESIKRQNESRIIGMPNGTVVRIDRNVTTTISN